MAPQLWLIPHGETEWTLASTHTGSTDIPLTDAGRRQAFKLRISGEPSFRTGAGQPLSRAREADELAGFRKAAQIEPSLVEW